MTYYASPDERIRLVAGLRDLAAFLESRPDVPAPTDATVWVFPQDGSDPERFAEIDDIAVRIFTRACRTMAGHYVASRFFGPVEYRAVTIPRETNDDREGRGQK